ncbi:MAG: DUF2726 domain-containing protein [Betaproteobacteria bacterium]|jgi:hypothetical protein|nr:DUF2726 domain-containing protein [Betaproteobacteria bacterium]MBP6319872.1 DUF2726 domain-containing protein [Rubrivivax sp.]MBK7276373.1 DUF2726 domain-containing protein [Betaproteobacteria bacterium]MBK7460359.1 DUF2726 domain-containing protein [Betaproteobacteria bacterium]MBK7516282.1 DUF2726 domain-containing protein [Betaproteobacteria bacterium]
MEFLTPTASFALPATVLLLLTLLFVRIRQRQGERRGRAANEVLDTVAAWPPESVRVLSITERQAHELLKRAMPGYLVLAQVPLARFIRVPARRSYGDWLQRVGSLSADLLLCDSGSRVLAVIDVRAAQETERSRKRHERLGRVLKAAGIQVLVWREGELPSLSHVRSSMAALIGEPSQGAQPVASRPMPLIPVADIAQVLADGDRAALEAELDATMEPVPSGFFDDFEPSPSAR